MAKPPVSLPASSKGAPVTVSLIIGRPGFTPLHAPLFDLVLPALQPIPVNPEEYLYHVCPAPSVCTPSSLRAPSPTVTFTSGLYVY